MAEDDGYKREAASGLQSMAAPPPSLSDRGQTLQYESWKEVQDFHGIQGRFRGVFLFLYITALILGVACVVTATASSLAIIDANARSAGARPGNSTATNNEMIGIPAIVCANGLILILAGLRGIPGGSGERLLLIATLTMAAFQCFGFVASNFAENAATLTLHHGAFGSLHLLLINRLIVSLTFPTLSIVAIAAFYRSGNAGLPLQYESPWMPLAKTLAVIAILSGTLLGLHYGAYLIEFRRNAFFHSSVKGYISSYETVGMMRRTRLREMWWTCLGECIAAGVAALGGILILFRKPSGRMFLLGGWGWLLYAAVHQQRGISLRNPAQGFAQLVGPGVLASYFVFAAIILIRRRLFQHRTR